MATKDKAHKRLLKAVNSVCKFKAIPKSSRNESQVQPDEFHVIKTAPAAVAEDDKDKHVRVSDIGRILKSTKKFVKSGKQLANVHKSKNKVKKPLEKVSSERIQRTVAFNVAKQSLKRWDALVESNRNADLKVFPLEADKLDKTISDKPPELSCKSDLIKQMTEIDNQLKNLQSATPSETREKKKAEKMVLDRKQLLEKRREIQYLRMRESQHLAKLRHRNKIKSKSYRRMLKRQNKNAKDKSSLHQEDEASKIQRDCVLERATLKHRNSRLANKRRVATEIEQNDDLSEPAKTKLEKSLPCASANNDLANDTDEMIQGEEEVRYTTNPWVKPKAPAQTTLQTSNNFGNNVDDATSWRKYWLNRNKAEKSKQNLRDDGISSEKKKPGQAASENGCRVESSGKNGPGLVKTEQQSNRENIAKIDPQRFKTLNLKASKYSERDDGDLSVGFMNANLIDAFEDDDAVVVPDVKAQADASSSANPMETGLLTSLPGWGHWSTSAKDQNHQRINRKPIKGANSSNGSEAGDSSKTTVYINEEASKHLKPHLVSNVAFPFTSQEDYEASISKPIGRECVSETAFRSLVRPEVIAHKGHIIEPIDEDVLLKNKKIRKNRTAKPTL